MTGIEEGFQDMEDLKVRCPRCGNTDPNVMIAFSRQWVILGTMTQPADLEPTLPDSHDTVQCENLREDGTRCSYRDDLTRFILAGGGRKVQARDTAEEHGVDTDAPAATVDEPETNPWPLAEAPESPKAGTRIREAMPLRAPRVTARKPVLSIARVEPDDDLTYETDEVDPAAYADDDGAPYEEAGV
jgi:hypothetical protein